MQNLLINNFENVLIHIYMYLCVYMCIYLQVLKSNAYC